MAIMGRGYTQDGIGSHIDQFFCQRPHLIRITGGPVKLDPEIATFRATQLGERTPGTYEPRLRNPITHRNCPLSRRSAASTETAARAASDQVAAPPKMLMNSRHLT